MQEKHLREPFRWNPLRSIGTKIALMTIAAILAFVAVTGVVSYQISKRALEREVTSAYQETALQTSQKLDFLYNSFDKILLQMMVDKTMQNTILEMLEKKDQPEEYTQLADNLDTILQSYMFSDAYITSIEVLEMDGTIVPTRSGLLASKNYGDEEWFKMIVQRSGQSVWIDHNLEGNRNTNPTITLGRVISGEGVAQGYCVILIDIDLAAIKEQVENVRMGAGGSIQVISPQNQIIYSKASSQVGKASDVTLPPEGMSKPEFSFLTPDKSKRVVMAKSETNGWFTIGTIPVSEMLKETRLIFQAMLWVLGSAFILALLLGWLIARMIGKPLSHLRDLMKQGADGNLQVRTNATSTDEIGQVGKSFDEMMVHLTDLVHHTGKSAAEMLAMASDLSHVSLNTEETAKEIAAATADIAKGGEGLASDAERGKLLAQRSREQTEMLVQTSKEMQNLAEDVDGTSRIGTEYMLQLIQKTEDMEERIGSITGKVEKLQDSTKSISDVLDILTQLMKQTHVLSLNATIEAARAGSYGKGFRVVADEIRALSEQAKRSVDAVGQITEAIQEDIEETAQVLNDSGPIFMQQISSVRNADKLFNQVGSQMGELMTRLKLVNSSILDLEQSQLLLSDAMLGVSIVSDQSLATSEEVASLSSEQLGISSGLVQLSKKLQVLSGILKDSLARFKI
ncbi:methyl-accepting chemotaxis protein [Paenibacillus chibensis]|uniref:methyl-accepting chemotaxis protein n=1 Tax=Paenibacillus chibensis TaxID=59846 RepID=UPI000FDBA92E|nr:methyl-accepting chemotaxis protein [Paenibacillus chibensis]MEC0369776.1 methyl-accepting chemotaxis protein [Paenibacillus chibensis]